MSDETQAGGRDAAGDDANDVARLARVLIYDDEPPWLSDREEAADLLRMLLARAERAEAERDALRKALDEARAERDEARQLAERGVELLDRAKDVRKSQAAEATIRGIKDGRDAAHGEVATLAGQMAEEHRARAARRFLSTSKMFDLGAADALDALRKHLEARNG